ncbi:MAG: acyl-ACP--UDP-N-acetylglucosamine O-acyltransferase [Phycisphaerales bacterium]|nr:acyl-ACP--UDP-N-acetylglucosamine O-acyltransferase [Phycisphaerales bacterium]
MNSIHPTAIVDPKAELGDNVEIGPYCVIGPYVEIGSGARLLNHVTVCGPTTIGVDNTVYPFSVIGADPQDLKFRGEEAPCVVGDRNVIREHVTIHRGTRVGGGITRVGSDNLIMVAAHIAHDCIVGSHCVIANQVMVGGHAVIEDCANIGGGAGIHHYTTVGTMSFVGGLCRVKKDVPPYMKVEGDPVEVRGVNTIALTRRAYSEHEINALKEAYKRLFLHPRTATAANGHRLTGAQREAARSVAMSDRIDELLREYPQFPTVVRLCQSLRDAAGGVHGRSRELAREDSKYATPVK